LRAERSGVPCPRDAGQPRQGVRNPRLTCQQNLWAVRRPGGGSRSGTEPRPGFCSRISARWRAYFLVGPLCDEMRIPAVAMESEAPGSCYRSGHTIWRFSLRTTAAELAENPKGAACQGDGRQSSPSNRSRDRKWACQGCFSKPDPGARQNCQSCGSIFRDKRYRHVTARRFSLSADVSLGVPRVECRPWTTAKPRSLYCLASYVVRLQQ
jgi:hypothetical protein